MAEKIIQNPSITTNVFEYDGAGRVSAISGHPLAGEGGGEVVKSDLMWKPTVESDGYVHWTLTSSATTPEAAYISGAQGPQGPSGTNGTDGTDGISPTFTITPIAGGTHVTISGAQGEEGFDVLSGAKGTDGAAGFSPTIALTPVNSDASHNNGGTQVEITYKNGESTATTAYTAWNGNDGEGASVVLFGNNGVSVTNDGTSYTLGLSGGYYANTLSAYSAMYAGYASNAKFSDNSVSSTDQIKGSIDWGNQIASEYVTHSGDYATSSSQVIAGNKQYALTTAGWASVETAYLPTSGGTVSGKTTISGSSFDTLELLRGGQTVTGAIGINGAGGMSFKITDSSSNNTQLNIAPNATMDKRFSIGDSPYSPSAYLIPAVTSTTTAGLTDDGILHIIVEN